MKINTSTYIVWGLIAVVFLVIGWQLTVAFTPVCPGIKSDTSYRKQDTTKFKMPKPVISYRDTGTIKYRDTGSIKLIPIKPLSKEDSVKIYLAFFSMNVDTATIINNSDLWVQLKYGISRNKLVSGEGKYLIKKPLQIINNTISNPAVNQLYVGAEFGGNLNAFAIGGRIILKTKTDALYGVSVDYLPMLSKQPMFLFSRDFKIRLRK